MGIKLEGLDEALVLRDRLKNLDIFIRGVSDWGGPVALTFGSYECTVMGSNRFLHEILYRERETIVARLCELGVDA